jgi:hypothetical protein
MITLPQVSRTDTDDLIIPSLTADHRLLSALAPLGLECSEPALSDPFLALIWADRDRVTGA